MFKCCTEVRNNGYGARSHLAGVVQRVLGVFCVCDLKRRFFGETRLPIAMLSSDDTDRTRLLFIKRVHLDPKSFVVLIVSLQSLAVVSIVLDLPVVRQVTGFLYLTLVPGIVMMRALKLKESTIAEHVSISVGLSISLIMLLGYLANELGLIMGDQHPLSLASFLFPLSIFVLAACTYIYLAEGKLESKNHPTVTIKSKRSWLVVPILMGFPFISLVGSFLSSNFSNNTVLLFLIVGISAVYLLIAIFAKIVPAKLYPLALFAIAIALLLSTTMMSKYITGYDLHSEFYCFDLTRTNSRWTPDILGVSTPATSGTVVIQSYASMLSITILPLFYSVVLKLSGELIFKVVYPIIFSIFPVALFCVYKEFFEERRAVLAVFFFVSYATFYVQMAYLARQMIGELFFVLLLLLYAKNGFKIEDRARRSVLFLFFFFGIVVSHYSMTYLLIFYVLCFVIVASAKEHELNMTGVTHLLLLVTLALTWYFFSFYSGAIIDLSESLNRMIVGFSDFLGGRNPTILKAIGVVSLPSMWRRIGQYTFYVVEILMGAGFLKFLATRKKLGSNQLLFSGTLVGMSLLALSIALPNFSNTLNITRIFQIALFFLSPMIVLGSETLFSLIFRALHHVHKGLSWNLAHRISIVSVAVVIVIFFLFQSGFIFALVGDIPASPSLTTDRTEAALKNLSLYDSFTFPEDVYGARWALANIGNQSQIYSDFTSQMSVLRSYGLVGENRVHPFTNNTESIDRNAYVYLRSLNTIYHIVENERSSWIIPENSSVLENTDPIYSNGGCQIFIGAGN